MASWGGQMKLSRYISTMTPELGGLAWRGWGSKLAALFILIIHCVVPGSKVNVMHFFNKINRGSN